MRVFAFGLWMFCTLAPDALALKDSNTPMASGTEPSPYVPSLLQA